MRKEDLPVFVDFMHGLKEFCIGKDFPSDAKIQGYFLMLKDVPLETVQKNAYLYIQNENEPFFPSVAVLRNYGRDPEMDAVHAFEKIKSYLDQYYFPAIGKSMYEYIQKKMESNGDGHLVSFLARWGREILTTNQVGVVRAQFVKSYQASVKIDRIDRQLEGAESFKQLVAGTVKQLDNKKTLGE